MDNTFTASPGETIDPATGGAGILPGEEFEPLRTHLHGALTLPHQSGWDAARAAWQLLADQRPAAVVDAVDAHDVAETVAAARRLGLAVAPQATGHAATSLPGLAGAILLRTARLDQVSIDPVARTARVGAGARWGAVAAAAAEHGLAVVSGMSPTVGVTGFLLGGGLGWFARSHGLGTNSLRALEVVDAQGRTIAVDSGRNPELFWAARGGMLPAVVTALEIELHPLPLLWAGALTWPIERAGEVAHAWRDWIRTVPNSVTSLVRVLRFPPVPQVPAHLRGRSFVVVEAAIQADAAATDRLLAPLRALEPVADTFAPRQPAGLGDIHGDPQDPSPAWGEAVTLTAITAQALDAWLGAATAEDSPFVSIEVRHLGGAVARGGEGAVTSLPFEGLVYAVAIVPVTEALPVAQHASAKLVERLAPFASPRMAKTFAERPVAARRLYGDATDRLREIAARWDPAGLIRSGHPLT